MQDFCSENVRFAETDLRRVLIAISFEFHQFHYTPIPWPKVSLKIEGKREFAGQRTDNDRILIRPTLLARPFSSVHPDEFSTVHTCKYILSLSLSLFLAERYIGSIKSHRRISPARSINDSTREIQR